jgi:hypothetical protein
MPRWPEGGTWLCASGRALSSTRLSHRKQRSHLLYSSVPVQNQWGRNWGLEWNWLPPASEERLPRCRVESIHSPSRFQWGGGDCGPGRRDALQDGAKGRGAELGPRGGEKKEARRQWRASSSQWHRKQGRRGGRGEQQYCFQHAMLLHVDSRFVLLVPRQFSSS